MHVGWFAHEQDPHKLILLSYTAGRWDLLVIPPETGADAAARLMAAAATPGGLLTASGLMASEDTTRDARRPEPGRGMGDRWRACLSDGRSTEPRPRVRAPPVS